MTTQSPAAEWKPHPSLDHAMMRQLNNNEFLFEAFETTQGRMSVATSLLVDFPSPVSAQDLLARLKKSWLYTRAQCPSLSVRIVQTEDLGSRIVFEDVLSPSQATKWADETCYIREIRDTDRSLDASLLEADLEDPALAKRTDEHHLECLIASDSAPHVERAWLRIWLDHKTMDGPSSRWLLSHVRRYLAWAPEKLSIDWGSEEERARQRERLPPGTALSLLKEEYRSQGTDEERAKEWAERLRMFNKDKYSTLTPFTGATANDASAARTYSTRVSLPPDASRRTRDFCRQHDISVSALLLSTVVMRQTLLRSSRPWPLPEDACFVAMFPVDTRSAWNEDEQTTIGIYTGYAACTIRTGQILQGVQDPTAMTKDEVRAAMLRGAKEASQTYNWYRKEANRAQLCAQTEAYLAELNSAMMAGEMDMSTIPFWLFSDGIIGAPLLDDDADVIVQPGGLQTVARDYDLRNTGIFTCFRTWNWRGQTVLSLTDSALQASRAEIDEMLRAWRDHTVDVVENATVTM